MPAPVRRELGVRTAFNLLGPLTNPAGATRQLVGVPRPEFTELMARALMLLGIGARVGRARRRRHRRDYDDRLHEDLRVPRRRGQHVLSASGRRRPAEGAAGALKGGDAHENARIIERILDGERGPARDVVLLNAGAALFIAGAASSVDDGICTASRAIDRGDAQADARAAGRDFDRRGVRREAADSASTSAHRRPASPTIVAATRRIVEVREEREPLARAGGAGGRRDRRGPGRFAGGAVADATGST